MNTIDYTQTGGFPLDQNVLGFMQAQSQLAQQPANFGGQLCIISGCVVTGANVTSGFVAINGEILPFVGGTITAKVIIVETATNLTYEDGGVKPVQKTRYATFGDDGVTNYLWVDFSRHSLPSLYAELQDAIAGFNAVLETKSAIGHTHTLSSLGILKRAIVDIGDVTGKAPGYYNGFVTVLSAFGQDDLLRIFFGETLSTSNYMVSANLLSNGLEYNLDNDVSYVIRNRTTTSFDVAIREYNTCVQNLSLMYMIVEL